MKIELPPLPYDYTGMYLSFLSFVLLVFLIVMSHFLIFQLLSLRYLKLLSLFITTNIMQSMSQWPTRSEARSFAELRVKLCILSQTLTCALFS